MEPYSIGIDEHTHEDTHVAIIKGTEQRFRLVATSRIGRLPMTEKIALLRSIVQRNLPAQVIVCPSRPFLTILRDGCHHLGDDALIRIAQGKQIREKVNNRLERALELARIEPFHIQADALYAVALATAAVPSVLGLDHRVSKSG